MPQYFGAAARDVFGYTHWSFFCISVVMVAAIAVQGIAQQDRYGYHAGGAWYWTEQVSFGWPWFFCTATQESNMVFRNQATIQAGGYSVTEIQTNVMPINSLRLRYCPTGLGDSTLFLLPLVCNIAWWSGCVHLVRSSLPAGQRSSLRFSLRQLLVLQLLVAVAIGMENRWH